MTTRTIRLGTACLLAAVPLLPATPAHSQPAPIQPSSTQPAPTRETLPNGLRVVVVPNHLAPVVTTQLVYLAGSNDAPDGFPGTAHALEHMMFRGSQGLDKDQLYELGDRLGGAYNASTEETVTQYTYTVPATDLGLILKAEALRMTGASITQADWQQERGAIEQEVSRDLSSPMYEVLTQVTTTLFAGTPYEHDALGTRPSFDATDAALLRRFYETWYAPNNAILVIAGDVDPQAALAQARDAFAGIPSRPVPAHPSFTLHKAQPKNIATLSNLPIGLAVIATRMPGLATPDQATAAILADVIASERGPLFGLSVSGDALGTGFQYAAKAGVGTGFAYGAFPASQDPAPLVAQIRAILAAIGSGDIPPDLVEAAKRQRIAQLAFATDSIPGLAATWARALAVANLASPDDLARAYASVSLDDVKRLAHEVLADQGAVTAIVTPRGLNQPAPATGFGGTETIGSPPDHPVTLPEWAASALAAVQAPPPATPPDVTILPNGLRLIVQAEHVSPTVSVFGRVRIEPAMQEPPGQEGVAAVANQLFNYGTTTQDRLAFNAATDAIAAEETAGAQFVLKVAADQFEPGMRLLAENELHPALPEDAFKVVQQQTAQSLAGQLTSPPYQFGRAQREAVAPLGDPSLRQATPDTVRALTMDQVRAHVAAAYRPDRTTITIIGDVDPATAARIATETFGAWTNPKSADEAAPELPPIAPGAPMARRIPDASSTQDQVSLLAAITLPVTDPDRYTLTLGNTILGNGFSSRLFRDLRTRTGYTYSHRSALDFTRTRATYSVTFGADPANVAPARALVLRDIRDMQTTLVSDEELARAKAQMLRRLAMSRASIGAIASLYLTQTDLGLPLDSQTQAAASYQAATAEDIRRAFAKWIDPNGLSEIVRGPAPP